MPSLRSLTRSARGAVGEARATTGAKGEGQDSDGSGLASPETSEAREKPRQGSTKRTFLRDLIISSKAKLASSRAPSTNDGDDASSSTSSSNGSNRTGHDAEKAASGTRRGYQANHHLVPTVVLQLQHTGQLPIPSLHSNKPAQKLPSITQCTL
ncbi:hypothetical protein F5Y12DRAFT_171090 [Xylaria sp. FL1777]|nr:hypothetical protein F5Y12DRAFT_171090 [Xylaria sp. FL1777]